MYEKIRQIDGFPKTEIKTKTKKGQNLNLSFENIDIFYLEDCTNNKNKILLFYLITVIILIVIIFSIFIFYSKILGGITKRLPYSKEKSVEYKDTAVENKDGRFIIVKNAEGEPNTIAEIIVQNQLYFIPKISVIIPVYNIEEYLSDCLETVIKQTLKEIEIICIDDGSTDNSLDILKKYAKKDKRITILKQENLNSGVARNAGLSIAKGKYLSFLDSDDFFELNMLEEMYKKIKKEKSDIIICQSKAIDIDTGLLNEDKFNNNIRFDLIPNKKSFSALEVSNNIFQIFEGWAWDKLFKTNFIFSNNIRFQNIINFNDNQFTYTALCSAKSITTIKKKLYIKRHQHKKSLSSNRWKDPSCFLLSFEKIINNLEKLGLYELMKGSFWNWAIRLCILQLKYLDNISKEYLFNILHEKFNFWDYIDNSVPSSNRYRAIHYLKYQKAFPTINIAYTTNSKYFNTFLISLVSLLKNSEYENINVILLYNDINQFDLYKINELKVIHFFTLQTLYVSDELIKDFPFINWAIKETWFRYILADKFPNIDKILYLDCNTIVRKSLLPLWEIDMNDKLIGAVEEFSFSKDKAKKANLKDNFYFNAGVLLLNTKEWRKMKLNKKIVNHIKKTNKIFYEDHSSLNIITDMKKIRLEPEYNIMEAMQTNDICQYDTEYFELYKNSDPTILHFFGTKPNSNQLDDLFIKEFSKNEYILNGILNMHLSIPIVLSSDDKYSPFMYTTMISILENANKATYYIFFLLIPSNFSENIKKRIISINDKYKCSINFIYIENEFENLTMKIQHITFTTYYRLLIGDLLPKEFDKCIYLDVDLCVCKDLSELFNIDLQNNYIAGVISPNYYFSKEKECKRLNISNMKQYINAGMLVMNLKQIREDNITKTFIELSKRNYNSQDQDVLNVACFGKILTLPPKYNAQVMKLQENNPLLRSIYKEEDIIEAKNKPTIIHYSNKNKPWNNIGIYLEEYWWNIATKIPYINSLFKREKIYKNELKKLWYKKTKKILNLDRPKTFLEKIEWMNLYYTIPLKTKLSDKYLVRDWVEKKIGKEYLIPIFDTCFKFEDIKFEKLPQKFVIKCNHGSSYNYFVKDKSLLNITDAKIKVEQWLNLNYAFQSGIELQYRDIHPKIIIEEYIDNELGDLSEFEFICFNGKPKFILVDIKPLFKHNYYLFDLNWNLLSSKVTSYYFKFPEPKKPKNLNNLIRLASILSENFIFIRISFYIINEKIFFGKIKFTSSKKMEEGLPKMLNRELASLIKLPKLAYNLETGQYYEIEKLFSLFPYYMILASLIIKLLYTFWNIIKIFLYLG